MNKDKDQLKAIVVIVILIVTFLVVRSLFGFYSTGNYYNEDIQEELRG